MLICVGGGALIAGLALAAIVLRSPGLAHGPTGNRDFGIGHYRAPTYSLHSLGFTAPPRQGDSAVTGAIAGVGVIVAVAVLLAIAVAIVWGLVIWWQRRPRRQRIPASTADPVHVLRDGIEEAQQRLRFGAPEDSIIDCWAALEEAAARSGTAPDPAGTPSEFVIRLLDSHDADSEALQRLSTLYRRARFGSEPSSEADRESARENLELIATSLRVRVGAR